MKLVALGKVLTLADSGTWGEEPEGPAGHPVLRSSNIHENRLVLEGAALRLIPEKHATSKRLLADDIVVVTSSGSPAHIGKCALFRPPDDRPYYFSNFTLRLRADRRLADPRWIYYWLASPRGRAVIDAMNNTTSGLRNLNKGLYLAQQLPLPPITEQARLADLLERAEAVRMKQVQVLAAADELRSALVQRAFRGDL